MIIKNAYYPKQMPTKIVIETTGGEFFAADLAPFRKLKETELQKLAVFIVPEMGDEIPGYTLKLYGLEREAENVLKRSRQHLGITQAQLAAASGVNVRQIQKIEAGEILISNVTLANAKRLADALGVKIEDLLL